MTSKNRTLSDCIGYGLCIYFLRLSFRNTSKALSFLYIVKRSHVPYITGHKNINPKKICQRKSKYLTYY
jgi:hypothetical protein